MNKIVVITGANSGIGLSLKEKFLKQKEIVISLDKNAVTNGETEFKCDVSNEEQVFQVFNAIGEMYKKIDILINCAGYAVFGATELIDTQKAKNMFDVNYFGTLSCIKGALKFMNKGAKIFNISSACSIFAVPFRTHYSASKAAVSMLSYGLRMELKDSGVDVVCINPGDVRTNFSKNRVKTFETNFRYKDRILKSSKQIEMRESKRMSLEYASKKIFKICTKTKTKPMYIVGSQIKWLNFFNKIFPLSVILSITNKKL